MILVYTDKITNRVKFIFNLIFREILKVDVSFTSNKEEYLSYEGVKLSYLKNPLQGGLSFAAVNLLKERGITNIDLSFLVYENLPAFFPVYYKESAMPFDPFAASFYLVSRYEEYLPYRKDEYGRFSANESLAFQKNFLQKPLVNIWAKRISELILVKFPSFTFPKSRYKYLPTIDIDAAWAYKEKGMFRTIGGYANAISKMDMADMATRTKVLTGFQTDPFDTFDYHLEIQKQYNLKPIFFILFAEYGHNDKNIPLQNRKFHTLIKSLADYAEVGIHPSYNSNFYPKKLKVEIGRLSKVLNREITKSRQHFLKVHLPTTYRNLVNLDIKDEYSMGFAAHPGFRASICNSFNFYDLDLDVETKLRIHPFTLMDGTLRDYMQVEANDAITFIKTLIDEVKAVNGTFVSLWHNESLSDLNRWKGWRKVYEEMVREAQP